ncbi:hypothetical protein BRADI_2g56820v3 [Brachypodium distachyon]|uniref:Pectinesterase n=2 Tax=Brachypodium distachyon TaxID=15368 RepID=I1HTZ1_BRADI|nr:hypothetical protein BRADI_2g56820v3 [Brachypodium distachyon]
MPPPPLRLLFILLLLFHIPFSLSSGHSHSRRHRAPAPSPATPPAASDTAPLPVLLACNATRFKPVCVSTLSAANATSTPDLLAATLSALRCRIPPAVSTARSILSSSSSNVNLSSAATNCLTLLSISSHRLSPSPAPSLISASAALLHLYDCWSAYKYVNTSRTISDAMAYLNDAIAVSSNYISMLAAQIRYGDDTSRWAPPQTERDGYWPSAAADAEADVDALGVPRGLPADATVCRDGCDYETVKEAVAAAPDDNGGGKRFVVRVKEGVYKESVSVPWEKTNLVLVGDGMGKTVITGDRNADTPGVSTFNTATVGVLADGFMARDLTIANTAGPDAHQAVAFRSTGDRTVLDAVELLGHQDTLYAHAMRQFYTRCRVSGTVDFVFGNSAALLHDTLLLVLPRQLHPEKGETDAVTAQGRTDPAQPTGIVLSRCAVNGSEEYMAMYRQKPDAHRVYLGRPWKEYSRTVFVGCALAEIVQPQGWMPWSGDFALETLYYGEYDSAGPGGGDRSRSRVKWSSQVPKEHVDVYGVASFIQGDKWIPKVQ